MTIVVLIPASHRQKLVNISFFFETKKDSAAIQIESFRWNRTKSNDIWFMAFWKVFEYNRNKLIKSCRFGAKSDSSLDCNLFSNLQRGNISLSATKWARKMRRMCYNIISGIITNKGKYKFLRSGAWSNTSRTNNGAEFSFSWCLCLKSHKSFIKKWNWIDRLNYKSLKFTVFFIIALMWKEEKWREREMANNIF